MQDKKRDKETILRRWMIGGLCLGVMTGIIFLGFVLTTPDVENIPLNTYYNPNTSILAPWIGYNITHNDETNDHDLFNGTYAAEVGTNDSLSHVDITVTREP